MPTGLPLAIMDRRTIEKLWWGLILILCTSFSTSKGIMSRLSDVTDPKYLPEDEDFMSLLKSIDDIINFNHSNSQYTREAQVQQSPDVRAQEIVDKMTFEQKFKLIGGYFSLGAKFGPVGRTAPIPLLKVPVLNLHDGPSGIGWFPFFATAFPNTLTMSASWDPSLSYAYSAAIAQEELIRGVQGFLAPIVDLTRTPLAGRNFEALGEDPYLTTALSSAYIQGAQDRGVFATAKHLGSLMMELYNEDGSPGPSNRNNFNTNIPEKAWRELYLPPYKMAAAIGVGAVMCAYGSLNHTRSCSNKKVFDTLRDEFGYKGFIMTDWGAAIGNSSEQFALSGLDMEMPYRDWYSLPKLGKAIEQGSVPLSILNNMNFRILRTMIVAGVLDESYLQRLRGYIPNLNAIASLSWKRRLLARRVLEESAVLAKNKDSILPLNPTVVKKIALFGKGAVAPLIGPYWIVGSQIPSGGVRGYLPVSPYRGLKKYIRLFLRQTRVDVTYTPTWSTPQKLNERANDADVCVVIVQTSSGEGEDRKNLDFPAEENELVDIVSKANPNTIVIVTTPGPSVMPWVDKVKGILVVFLPGVAFGDALARLLFGEINPSGKMSFSFPVTENDTWIQTPTQYPGVPFGDVTFTEGVFMGYRWYDQQNKDPLFSFGHGLSYASFSYSNLQIQNIDTTTHNVTVSLSNTGPQKGKEVVQLYLGFPAPAEEPPKILKGFQKVMVDVGQTLSVTLPLKLQDFESWSVIKGAWEVVPGTYQVYVGSSSRDIRLSGAITIP